MNKMIVLIISMALVLSFLSSCDLFNSDDGTPTGDTHLPVTATTSTTMRSPMTAVISVTAEIPAIMRTLMTVIVPTVMKIPEIPEITVITGTITKT